MELSDYEYTVDQKCEGKWKLRKALMLTLYFVYTIIYFLVIYITRVIPLGALIPVTLWILIFFTWRYVKPEYKYRIESAFLTFTVIYGSRTRKEIFKTKICDAEKIIPLSEAEEDIRIFNPTTKYNALPSAICDDSYVMLFTDERGNHCIFTFKATAQALKSFRFYNNRTKIVTTAL